MKFMVATSTVALVATHVQAHGYLSRPSANFLNGIDTKYNAILTETCDPAFAGLKWNDSPEANTAMFAKAFPNSQFKTLKELMDTIAPDCGNTILTGAPVDVSSLSSMTWQNDQEQKGFIDSHHGPCEGWIDGTRVFHSDDCRADFPGYPAEIPVDFSSCTGDCTFTFYWLALHEPDWQVYKQCASITTGSGGATQSGAPDGSVPPSSVSTVASPSSTDGSNSVEPVPATNNATSSNIVATTSAPVSGSDLPIAPTTTAPASASEYTTAPAATSVPSNGTSTPTAAGATKMPTSSCKSRRRLRTNLHLKN